MGRTLPSSSNGMSKCSKLLRRSRLRIAEPLLLSRHLKCEVGPLFRVIAYEIQCRQCGAGCSQKAGAVSRRMQTRGQELATGKRRQCRRSGGRLRHTGLRFSKPVWPFLSW